MDKKGHLGHPKRVCWGIVQRPGEHPGGVPHESTRALLSWRCLLPRMRASMATAATGCRAAAASHTLVPRASMTILIPCPQCRDRDFQSSCTRHVPRYLWSACSDLPCQSHFVILMSRVRVPRYVYLTGGHGPCTSFNFIDSMPRAVCHHRRSARPRVLARRGAKTP